MKILIAADMEGVSGVTKWDHVMPDHPEYTRFRRIMTEEINSAIRGAFDAGADEVLVTDGHAYGNNVLIETLDPRVCLNSGNDSPFSMIQGISSEVNGVIFIGYHARAGSQNAVLAHTWSSSRIANVWLNDTLVGEYGLNAAVAGHYDVPVLMITGDQTVCAQAVELLGPLETVVVKRATGFAAAECRPPSVTQEEIYQAAKGAVQRLKKGKASKPYLVSAPIRMSIEFLNPEHADRAVRLVGVKRLDGRRIEFTAQDMLAAYTTFRAAVKQAFD